METFKDPGLERRALRENYFRVYISRPLVKRHNRVRILDDAFTLRHRVLGASIGLLPIRQVLIKCTYTGQISP